MTSYVLSYILKVIISYNSTNQIMNVGGLGLSHNWCNYIGHLFKEVCIDAACLAALTVREFSIKYEVIS